MRRFWTKDEVARLRELYPNKGNKELAKMFRRSEVAIFGKAGELGLRKSEKYLKSIRWQNGHVPHNKGKQFPPTGRMKETQFKKGHVPHCWKQIGTERIAKDGYIERKVSDTRTRKDWVPVQNIVWIQAHREIPKGHIVVFKNRNKTDFRLENLELISRQENMLRNSIHVKYPLEIRQVMQLRGALNRQIRKLEKQK